MLWSVASLTMQAVGELRMCADAGWAAGPSPEVTVPGHHRGCPGDGGAMLWRGCVPEGECSAPLAA